MRRRRATTETAATEIAARTRRPGAAPSFSQPVDPGPSPRRPERPQHSKLKQVNDAIITKVRVRVTIMATAELLPGAFVVTLQPLPPASLWQAIHHDAERHQEQITMMSSATGKPTPNVSTMIMTNAKQAESTGALARTSSPDISSPLEPPRASARRPKVKL